MNILLSALLLVPSLVINEVMQSNVDCVMDDKNEFPDSWVELFNASSEKVNLDEYALGIGSTYTTAWALPQYVIPAKGHVLIYCDKDATGLHTSFRLTSDEKSVIRLFHSQQVADSMIVPKQPFPNIAYGRASDNDSVMGYILTPTPGRMNRGLARGVLGTPSFSHQGRVMVPSSKEKISLTLSLPKGTPESAEIRYTLDGTEPKASSMLYNAPLSIDSTMIVRARLFLDGYVSAPSHTESFISHGRRLHLPIVAITTDPRYLYNDTLGIYVEGTYNPGIYNYNYDWRRPINIEFFVDAGSAAPLNQLCEMRIQGGATRSCKIKSLALYANKRFGEKRFQYVFFPDQRPGENRYKSLLLRNAGNDFDGLYMRDAIIQRAMARYADIDWQAWRPAIVYMNGKYIGIQNIRERSNEDNLYTSYDKLEDVDAIKNWGEVLEGTGDEWEKFKQFYTETGHTWEEYQQQLDCYEFINIMVMNLFFDNKDFPANNIVFWRPRNAKDGWPMRWRVIAKDTDFGLGLYGVKPDYNTIYWLYHNNYDKSNQWGNADYGTVLFRHAMRDITFKRAFLDRAAIYVGDFLNYDRIWPETWEPMYDMISKEYPTHRYDINPWWPNYSEELATAQEWLKKRSNCFIQQLAKYFNWGNAVPVTISYSDTTHLTEADSITFNGVCLTRPSWSGLFYSKRAITLQANTDGWRIVTVGESGRTSETQSGPVCTYTMSSDAQAVYITALKATDVADVNAQTTDDCRKILRDGHLYIIRDGQTYTITGSSCPETHP